MLPLFAITIFISAALLFMVQPMIAKMVLPLLGGSPAVWNTCMVFFQAALLAGYLYAHLTSRLSLRRQAILHLLIVLTPLLVLPIAIRTAGIASAAPPTSTSPIPWLLLTLTLSVGLPFFVASTTGPLMQRWFGATSHRAARDPYFLYAASNAGSLLALLAYPFLLEPASTIPEQSTLWTFGYILLALLVIACGVIIIRKAPPSASATDHPGAAALQPAPTSAAAPLTRRQLFLQRLLWILLAFIPSSLMLGATQYVSTDVAAVPMLWVLPLAIYLLTFILAFASRRPFTTQGLSEAVPVALAALAVIFLVRGEYRLPVWGLFALNFAALFIAALYCHSRLADLRPPLHRLTEFYLLLALGGVLGGAFNGLVAPTLFSSVIEYPLVLILVCFVRLPSQRTLPLLNRLPRRLGLPFDAAAAILIGLLIFFLDDLAFNLDIRNVGIRLGLSVGIPAILLYLLSPRRIGFALGTAALLGIAIINQPTVGRLLHQERTFFGVYRIFRNDNILPPQFAFTTLIHGTTVHGVQFTDPEEAKIPRSYYHPKGPVGDLFTALKDSPLLGQIGAVGLGTGAIAAYGQPGQVITFHEIDPAMVEIAQNPAYFTFLRDSQAEVRFIIGDGRLTLAHLPDASYGLIILDAFSSDAIPVHLLTKEAIELYFTKLKPGGLIAVHISNQYLYLGPVLARIAQELGLTAVSRIDAPPATEQAETQRSNSEWAILARTPADLGKLAANPLWFPLKPEPGDPLWTDSYSNIISVFGE